MEKNVAVVSLVWYAGQRQEPFPFSRPGAFFRTIMISFPSPAITMEEAHRCDINDRFCSFFEYQGGDLLSSSQRSTLTVEGKKKVQLCSEKTTASTSSKRVHFPANHVECIVREDDANDHVEIESRKWYSNEDLTRFRKDFVEQARQVARFHRKSNPKGCGSNLVQLFRECMKGNNLSLQEDGMTPTTRSLDGMFQAFSGGDTVVGLERMATRQIACEKPRRRRLLMRTIRKMQTMTQVSIVEEQEEDLRVACERISRPSRLFAIQLAMSLTQE